MSVKIFCGIADCHGLESFFETDKMGVCPSTLGFRVRGNRHRHAVIYWVELNAKQERMMQKAIKQAQEDGEWHKPLHLLKNPDFVENVFPEAKMLKSWKMIPNDDLDPYW
tara:strand:- start:338 stop:667 length:330 start_codon:yes stop_codon:yes gene_type:complete